MSKPTFNLMGDIVANDSERWFESDVVPGMVIGWLNKQEGDVEININSNGGDVAGGLAIANAIKAYNKGEVTCNVLGLAASMASVIACAGQTLKMGQGAFLMLHNPWTVTMGNAEDLRKDADLLDKMRDSILSFYQSKTTKTADELKAIMDAETWIAREDAEEYGFTVEDYGEFKAAASLTRRAFDKAPEAARQFFDFKAEKPVTEPAEPTAEPVAGNWEARFKGLSTKYNEQKAAHDAEIAAIKADFQKQLDAAVQDRATLQGQLEKSAKDLIDANAKVSELGAKLDESAKALQKATDDLTATRDSLKAAEDKADELIKSRDLLTAGVLVTQTEASYQAQMNAAKTPEAREALRAKKAAGKIK